jgi:serine/threonine protein kinase
MFILLVIFFIFLDTFEHLLGKGGFGKVYLAVKDVKKFAIKMVSCMDDDDQKFADSEERCFTLLKDSSPYIVKFFESFKDVLVVILFIYYLLKRTITCILSWNIVKLGL